MKKIVSLALAATLTVSMCASMTACGSSSSSSDEIKIGLITLHDENSTYDNNFITAFNAACEATGATPVIISNIGEEQACYDAAAELADDDGCDIVFADSFGHEDYLIQAAEEFPEVQFCHATGTQAHLDTAPDNFHNAFASIYEGRYLAGIAAGEKLNEMIANGEITADQAVIGYVGAYTYAEVISGYTSFFLGAQSVCPTATMKVTFTGSWYDQDMEKTAAENLIDKGCVLISQHADSMGAPSACEAAGVPDVSYNGSTADSCPNTYIVSSYINWEPYFEYIINQVKNGESIEDDYIGTIDSGSVCLTDLGDAAAEGTQEAIDAAEAAFADGSLHVFDCSKFTVTVTDELNVNATVDADGHLTAYLADLDGDYTGDTDVITDGYFDESGASFRSAPYFDVQIDGIELLDTSF